MMDRFAEPDEIPVVGTCTYCYGDCLKGDEGILVDDTYIVHEDCLDDWFREAHSVRSITFGEDE